MEVPRQNYKSSYIERIRVDNEKFEELKYRIFNAQKRQDEIIREEEVNND